MLSSLHVEHNFSLMVPCLQSLMGLFRLVQQKDLIEVNDELALIDEPGQFDQLSPIRPEVEQMRVNVTCGSHLLKVNNGDEPTTIAHNVQTSCGCLSTHAVQDSIDALRMSRVDSLREVRLRIVNVLACSQLLKVRVVLAPP